MRRILLATLIVAAVPLASLTSSVGASKSAGWIVGCGFSHRSTDDPIVMPDMSGMSHSHDFFGNETTDAGSTVSSLVGKPTTCSLAADTSAYWIPTLYQNGTAVQPIKAAIYYRTRVDGGRVQPFPLGLMLIAGDSHATAPQSTENVYYNCHDGPDTHHAAIPYDCGTHLIDAHIVFPQCWDGVHLDAVDHKSHVVYPTLSHGIRTCPASNPVILPRLIIRISWPITNGDAVKLASGPAYTLHADFFNAWDPATQQRLVDDCINAGIDCGKQIDPKA
jgi:hypothetical protein